MTTYSSILYLDPVQTDELEIILRKCIEDCKKQGEEAKGRRIQIRESIAKELLKQLEDNTYMSSTNSFPFPKNNK